MVPPLIARAGPEFVPGAKHQLADIDHQCTAYQAFLSGVVVEIVLALRGFVTGKPVKLERYLAKLEGISPGQMHHIIGIELDVLGFTRGQAAVIPFHGIQQAQVQITGYIEFKRRAYQQLTFAGGEVVVLVVQFDTAGQRDVLDRAVAQGTIEHLAQEQLVAIDQIRLDGT
ncbi:hypothetical protein D3C78_627460 [compost metagenome]